MKIKKNSTKILAVLLSLLTIVLSIRFIFLKPKIVYADSLFKLDEGYGTNINDNNGNVTAGSITNAVWKSEEFCKVGKCLYFDGTGDYVSFADDTDLDMGSGETVTLEGWFRTPDITSGTRTLISKEEATGADGGYRVELDSGGFIRFGIDNENTSFPSDSITTSTAFDDNKWHHFAAVKNGSTSITLYIDAISIGTDSSIQNDVSNNDTFYIGSYFDVSASNGFSGFIDEVKVYRSARTQAEINADYTGVTPSRGTSASFGPDQSYLSSGLVGYWKMEEAGDATRLDSSGNGNTLTESASDTIAQVAGKFGNAGDFEKGDTEYLAVTDASQSGLDLTQSLTFSFWLNVESNTDSGGTYEGIITKASTSNWSYGVATNENNSNSLRFMLDNDGNAGGGDDIDITSAANIYSLGEWNQFTITYDGQYVRLFKNGLEHTGGNFPYSTNISIYNGSADFRLGNWESQTGYYDGILDEVRIYNRTLSPAEVAKLYSFAPGPIGYWKMDENTGTTANDISSNGYTGTLTNSPTWTSGKFGSSLYFPSSNDLINLNTGPTVKNLSQYTLQAWFKTPALPSSGTSETIYWEPKGDNGTLVRSKILIENADSGYANVANSLTFRFRDTDASSPSNVNTGANSISANTWYHVTAIFDSVSDIHSVYLNGVLVSTTSSSRNAVSNTTPADDIYIGQEESLENFRGYTDDVKVYNYARTPSQIVEDMNGGHPAPGSPIGSAVAYWKIDEGYSTTAYDGSINANNLTLSTASWTNSGKFGKAFNGLDNVRLSRTTDPDLEFGITDDFTISAWYKSDSAGVPAATEYLVNDGAAAGSAGYAIYANTSGNLCFGIDDDASWGPDVASCTTTDVYDNTWHHVTAVRNVTSDTTKIYIDGVEKDSDTDSTTATLDSSPTFYIGDANATNGTDEFLGDIDEVKIFRSALTADQVKVEYNRGSGQGLGALSTDSSGNASWSDTDSFCPPGQGSTCTPPVGHWKLDENTLNTCSGGTNDNCDTSTNSNDGALSNSGFSPGKFGSAIKTASTLDNNQDATSISDPASGILDFSDIQSFTFTMWFKGTVTDSGYSQIFSKGYTGAPTSVGYGADLNSITATVSCVYGDGALDYTEVTASVYDGAWHHLGCVLNREGTDTIYEYIDGVLVGTNSSISLGTLANATSLTIGELSTGDEVAAGGLDDVRIYNYARTPAQIAWDYNRGGPVGWWKMDESAWTNNCSTDTVFDSSGNALHGDSCPNTTGPLGGATGKLNSAGDFDGSDDRIDIANASAIDLNVGLAQGFTFGGWIFPDTDGEGDAGRIFDKGTNTYCKLGSESGGLATVSCRVDLATDAEFSATTKVTIGAWNHVAFSWTNDADDEATIWVNGIPNASSATFDGDPAADTTALTIGNVAAGSATFDGKIDDFRVYNYEATAQQIKTIMGEGAVRFGPASGSP